MSESAGIGLRLSQTSTPQVKLDGLTQTTVQQQGFTAIHKQQFSDPMSQALELNPEDNRTQAKAA